MKTLNAPQGSSAWLAARAGLITASRIKDVMSTLKNGGETAARNNYKWELISERMSGFTTNHINPESPDIKRGKELEPIARAEYEVETGNIVDQFGLVYHPHIEKSAASPDGLVGEDGAIELKCPRTTTQLKWILQGGVPPEHQLQCLWVMACCERDWLDFSSFDTSLPDGLRLFTVRMGRDEKRIAEIEAEVIRFDAEVEAVIAELRGKVKPAPEPEHAPEDMPDWAAAFGELVP